MTAVQPTKTAIPPTAHVSPVDPVLSAPVPPAAAEPQASADRPEQDREFFVGQRDIEEEADQEELLRILRELEREGLAEQRRRLFLRGGEAWMSLWIRSPGQRAAPSCPPSIIT